MSTIIPELSDTKSMQLPINRIYKKMPDWKSYVPFGDIFLITSFASSRETAIKRTHLSAPD